MNTIVVLHNIRSVFNIASIFRTAEGAGISCVYLTGYTPGPLDRFGTVRRDFAKVALGAEKTLAWKKIQRITDVFREVRKEGYTIVGVEQAPDAVSYADRSLRQRLRNTSVALVFGNEVRGLSSSIRKKTDILIEIPMSGTKESLNVSVAFGISTFVFRDFIHK